jgi:transposase-like protein
MSDTVAVCPECDAAEVHLNAPGGHNTAGRAHRYRCQACKAQFDTYEERARKEGIAPGHTPRGLAGRLARADPDEVGP